MEGGRFLTSQYECDGCSWLLRGRLCLQTDEKVTTVDLRVEGHFDTIYHFCCCLEGSSYHSCALCLIFSDAEEFVYLCLGLLTLLDYESQTRCISLPVLPSAYHSIMVGASPSLHYEGTESGPSRRQTSSAMEVGQIADSAYKRRRLMWQLGNRVQERLAQYRLTDAHDLD